MTFIYFFNRQRIVKVLTFIIATIFVSAVQTKSVIANDSLEKKGVNIVDIIESDDSLSLFAKCLEKSGIKSVLQQGGPYTVFVSNDAAYDKVSFSKKFAVWTNKKKMINILNFHIVKGRITSDQLKRIDSIETLHGSALNITNSNEIRVDDARLAKVDLQAINGIVHIIDKVILPPKS